MVQKKKKLVDEFLVLRDRFLSKNWPSDFKVVDKWLYFCNNSSFYMGCEEIMLFAHCCLVKSPCESIFESVVSAINRHGSKERSKMSNDNFNDEIFVFWNGPEEFSCEAQNLIRKSLHSYLPNKIHFYTSGSFSNSTAFTSKTLANILKYY